MALFIVLLKTVAASPAGHHSAGTRSFDRVLFLKTLPPETAHRCRPPSVMPNEKHFVKPLNEGADRAGGLFHRKSLGFSWLRTCPPNQ